MKKSKYLYSAVHCGIFTALGVLFPMIFHAFGAVSGQTFLPMHIPVLISGLTVSPVCGLAVGILSPFISSILTNMPLLSKMPFMCIELACYGFASGLLFRILSAKLKNRTLSLYLSLVGAQIVGRLVNLLCTFCAINILGITAQGLSMKLALMSIPAGAVGIVIQWILIPPCALAIQHMSDKQKPLS